MAPPADANATAASSVSLHERCQYPNKQCPNRRMTKRDGQLHRLCVAHRENANRNHRRWIETHVRAAKAKTASPAGNAAAATVENAASVDAQWENQASADPIDSLLLDKDELTEFLGELTLTAGELLTVQADIANACRRDEE